MELQENLKFERSPRPKIRPACLAQPNQFDLREVIATGWGKLGSNHDGKLVQNFVYIYKTMHGNGRII